MDFQPPATEFHVVSRSLEDRFSIFQAFINRLQEEILRHLQIFITYTFCELQYRRSVCSVKCRGHCTTIDTFIFFSFTHFNSEILKKVHKINIAISLSLHSRINVSVSLPLDKRQICIFCHCQCQSSKCVFVQKLNNNARV